MSSMANQNHSFEEDNDSARIQNNETLPIDETEEFQDPFSDLSLFLSKKIKTEVVAENSLTEWSQRIQGDLFKKILPEFKQLFPKYRLGAASLRSVWDKVSYFYGKLKEQQGALEQDGQLNVSYVIKENLKQFKQNYIPTEIPPYNYANHIALKVSECIATVEGEKPDLENLTRKIWSVQKHIQKQLTPMNAKSPFEEYQNIDKLIVKILLETTSTYPHFSYDELKESIHDQLYTLKETKGYIRYNQLTSIISSVLSQDAKVTKPVSDFINHQLEIRPHNNKSISIDTHRLEVVQCILSLYPIAQAMPHDVDEQLLKEAIRFVYFYNDGANSPEETPHFDPSIYVFINAEIHILEEMNMQLEDIEDCLLHSFRLSKALPSISLNELEKACWNQINIQEQILTKVPLRIIHTIDHEISNLFIDGPNHSFKHLVNLTHQFFQRVKDIPFDNDALLVKKIDSWALQNDMLTRFVHFDSRTPLLNYLLNFWKDNNSKESDIDHDLFLKKALKNFLKQNPNFTPYETQVNVRLTILYKYMWYNKFITEDETTFDRFIKWHSAPKKSLSKDSLKSFLKDVVSKKLPLTPYE